MAALACAGTLPAAAAARAAYVPGEVVVAYASGAGPAARAASAAGAGAVASTAPTGDAHVHVLHVAPGRERAAIARLRRQGRVRWAAPNPVAHASQLAEPLNDPGLPRLGGLIGTQWNFFGPWGVQATQAWANVAAVAPGGRGVRVAVLDTGIAYRDWRRFRRSSDFAATRFVAPYDFVAGNRFPLDRDRAGHGTHVAGTIAETPGNAVGVTGLAWGASIMPVRVLDGYGYGDAVNIARGIRWAARHGARVINLSLEFSGSVRASEIPGIVDAIHDADRRGALVIASSGNEAQQRVAYPARTDVAVAIGATTDAGCLSSFSNDGPGLDLVAPGGGDNADIADDPNCTFPHSGRDIVQQTYDGSFASFGLLGLGGTSMAAPHVSAAAALTIASGLLGAAPTPAQVECRLKLTATRLGLAAPNRVYGYGLVNAAAATDPQLATPACTAGSARLR
ncbi:S8 family serine peptidase [Conexibacter sp. JD483]|uniref:S8 family serine peptidase n=1 Tax=unclassified Conexibacter TaxID=2627773 RepID=UPI00271C7049|nr:MULTISPECIES: S8 family serine peptidase [unclassified Conexibacter]MDO8184976.1 S8 family serine peptidase [Conexibacter sp. CPCC 205706]MDO8198120.1 S8 family serine peptidase [Conexibacter sp. CPCC 205762]MDR9368258.1 S8 family serine peptidase [Conexibacter sp. JD483]